MPPKSAMPKAKKPAAAKKAARGEEAPVPVAAPPEAVADVLDTAEDGADVGAVDATAAKSGRKHAVHSDEVWHDDDDKLKPFQTSNQLPAWAQFDEESRKRSRDDDDETDDDDDVAISAVKALLRGTAPILKSKHQRKVAMTPKVTNILPIKGEEIRALQWHNSGEVLVVSGRKKVFVEHCAGKYTEKVAAWPILGARKSGTGGRTILTSGLAQGGNSLVILCTETYVPQLLDLSTGYISAMSCFDPRRGSSFRVQTKGGGREPYPTKLAVAPTAEAGQRCLIASDQTVTVASLAHASITNTIVLSDEVSACTFSGNVEIMVAARNRVYVYDIRNTARIVRDFVDEGSLQTSCLGIGATTLAIGSTSGVVNLYPRSVAEATGKPTKSLMNLNTACDCFSFGSWKGADVLAMSSSNQSNGLRLVSLPNGAVTPSFPDQGMQHGFITATAFNPVQPILSVGEKGRVVNYLLNL